MSTPLRRPHLPKPSTIAIDGTVASGKSTIGGLLAEQLGYTYLDTGAMYRAVTWVALQQGMDIADEEAITALAASIVINITRPTVYDGRQYTVYVNEQDVTWQIRRPEVDANVSPVSAYPGVRKALTDQQRRIGRQGRIVMVGRDIGTVVLPGADLKIYLDATVEERACRRYREILKRGEEANYKEVLASMLRRDRIDSEREAAPLCPADDAVIIDTTELSIAEVIAKVEELVWAGEPLRAGVHCRSLQLSAR
jgi:cytidylate kinase